MLQNNVLCFPFSSRSIGNCPRLVATGRLQQELGGTDLCAGAAAACSATTSSRHSTGAHLAATAPGDGGPAPPAPSATKYTHTHLKNGTRRPPTPSPLTCGTPHCCYEPDQSYFYEHEERIALCDYGHLLRYY